MKTATGVIAGVSVEAAKADETLFAWLDRVHGGFDVTKYRQVLGAANPFKEGDARQRLAAADHASRENARRLLSNTTIGSLLSHPIFDDEVVAFADARVDVAARRALERWTMGELVRFLQDESEEAIKAVMPGLTSDVIACAVKLMANDDLIAVARKVFNPLPGSNIGARGYMGARIQPNSPTDAPEDIVMQVFDGWSYAVGDVVLGTNPVSSDVDRVAAIELALRDVLVAFGLDARDAALRARAYRRAGGSRGAVPRLHGAVVSKPRRRRGRQCRVRHRRRQDDRLRRRRAAGRSGMYFETGQGADCDQRPRQRLRHGDPRVAQVRLRPRAQGRGRRRARRRGHAGEPWVHVNDVAGFIGPEVFRTKEQLVRVCLEDTVMGKLHGLTIGLDICSTLHMDVSLDDLDWCIEQVMPANPAYLMALPTKNDPMLSYLTTAFQDHVRVREKFGYKVNDRDVGVLPAAGRHRRPTAGRPATSAIRRGSTCSTAGRRAIRVMTRRSCTKPPVAWLACAAGACSSPSGHGARPWDLDPDLDRQVRRLYEDAKACIHAELPAHFQTALAPAVAVKTRSARSRRLRAPPAGRRDAGRRVARETCGASRQP